MSHHPDTRSPEEVRWLAELFAAGRGSFSLRRVQNKGNHYAYPSIRLVSVDPEWLQRVSDVLGAALGRNKGERRWEQERWQVIVIGSNAVAWLRAMRPYLVGARAVKVDRILEEFDAVDQDGARAASSVLAR